MSHEDTLCRIRAATPSRFLFIGAANAGLPLNKSISILSREFDSLNMRHEAICNQVIKGNTEIRINARCQSAFDRLAASGFRLARAFICRSLHLAGVPEDSLSDSSDLAEALLCQLEQRLGLRPQEIEADRYTHTPSPTQPSRIGN